MHDDLQRRSRGAVPTEGGKGLTAALRIAKLELQLGQVMRQVELLASIVDPDDIEAEKRLRLITPSHDEFEELAINANPPDELFAAE